MASPRARADRDARAGGRSGACSSGPWLLAAGRLLGAGLRQQVGGDLPARGVRAAGRGLVRRRPALVRRALARRQGRCSSTASRRSSTSCWSACRLRRDLDRLADARPPVRPVPLRTRSTPTTSRAARTAARTSRRQLQALADRDQPVSTASRLVQGSTRWLLPPRRLRLPHPLPQRLHPHLRLAAARLAAAQPPGRRRRRRPASSRAPRAATRPPGSDCLRQVLLLGTPALWWGGVLALLYARGRCGSGARDWRFGVAVVGAASTWLPWFLYDGRPIFSFYAIITLPFLVLALTLAHRQAARPRRARRRRGVRSASSSPARTSCW